MIHKVMHLSLASVVSATQRRELDDSASGIAKAKQFQLKPDLRLGMFHRAEYPMQ